MSELPNGWAIAKIGELCSLINGRAFKPQEWSNNGLPIIRIQNLNNRKAPFNHFSGALDERHLIKKKDLLFAWSGTPGTSFGAHIWHGDDAALNQHIFKIDFNTAAVERNFLRYAINQKLDELIGAAQGGVGLRHVTKGTFEETSISIPPHAEQARIAKALDGLLAQVDILKARLDALPALIKRFRQSVLTAAVSGELTEEIPKKNESGSSQGTPLSVVVEDIRYGTAQKCAYGGGPTGVLRIPNISGSGIDLSDLKSSSFSHAELEKLSLNAGDIVLIRSNGSVDLVGKSAVVTEREEGLLFAGYLIRIRLKRDIAEPAYINYWLKSPEARTAIENKARSTSGVNNINSQEILSLELMIPNLAEQRKIVKRADQLFAFADQLETRLADARQRVDALTQSILAKAFRGELVPQDPNDEPASVLLERIAAQRAADPKPKRGRKAAAH